MGKDKCVNTLKSTIKGKIMAIDVEIMHFVVIQAIQSILYLKR